ncbi:30S ribosome-binding factor RbfA [Patulibacter brassicae]|uniref:Ribosome-binding factor A n=1 Tax=Patulibacter brassicae TaxID=1705717 RepID=A0ABU4VE37_9ACTN|nr:30S ribosome-binding factor RbfA [Patulibacter brassicae]MDX8150058.1 30S ribosome-binding factor RbfA [Patulibacter brassicae]
MKPDRMRRVDEALRKVLGDVLQHEMKDPRIGFATITGVRTSSDLSHATVLVSVLPTPDAPEPEDTIAGLRSASGFLQRRIGHELGLKNTPVLRFELDETIDRAMRIQELLDDPPPPAVPSSEDDADGDAPPDDPATSGGASA